MLRMMVDDHDKACNALRAKGYSVEETEVIPVEMPDHPGGLNAVLGPIKEAGINIFQVNAYLGRSGENAILILGVADVTRARAVLEQNWIKVLDESVYGL